MNENLESRIKKILSMRRNLEAQLLFYQVDADYKQIDYKQNSEIAKLNCLLKGIDSLFLLVSEEERMILRLHLVEGMKWESVIAEYEKRWPYDRGADKRTYIYRQQTALKKISSYINQYARKIDFSWMTDPDFDEE